MRCVHWQFIIQVARSGGREAKSSPSVHGLSGCWLSLVNIQSGNGGLCRTFLLPHDCYSVSSEVWWSCLPKFASSSPISLSSAILIHLFPNPAVPECSGRFQRTHGAVQDLDNVNVAKFPPAVAMQPIRAQPYAHLIALLVRSVLAFLSDCRLTTWHVFNTNMVATRRKDSHV